MKFFIFSVLACSIFLNSYCQEVSNVKFRQEINTIIVNYDLIADDPVKVNLYCSTDGGNSFSNPLNNLSGDFGHDVSPGKNKEILWDVLASRKYLFGDNITFKVKAEINLGGVVFVEGGGFLMGFESGQTDEKPVHNVMVDDFYIGMCEVSQGLWMQIMNNNPSFNSGCANCPVEGISYNEIMTFIDLLNKKTGDNFRLPTEAEWEFAARGGTKSNGYYYSGSDDFDQVCWYNHSEKKTYEVGLKKSNELGLHDMSGNVWEVCSDFYDANYYEISPENNPNGPDFGSKIVIRGGATSVLSHVYNRNSIGLDTKLWNVGLRLVQEK